MAGGHAHHHGAVALNHRAARVVNTVVATLVLVVGAAIVFRPTGGIDPIRQRADQLLGFAKAVYDAHVEQTTNGTCQDSGIACREYRIRLDQGLDRGKTFIFEVPVGQLPVLHTGDDIVVSSVSKTGPLETQYYYSDRERKPALLGVVVRFALVVIALGRWRGLGALIGLGLSIVVIVLFMVPSILSGNNAIVVAMTVTQSAAVAELRAADPTMPRRALFRSAMKIGRDHVSSTVNTLALA